MQIKFKNVKGVKKVWLNGLLQSSVMDYTVQEVFKGDSYFPPSVSIKFHPAIGLQDGEQYEDLVTIEDVKEKVYEFKVKVNIETLKG